MWGEVVLFVVVQAFRAAKAKVSSRVAKGRPEIHGARVEI